MGMTALFSLSGTTFLNHSWKIPAFRQLTARVNKQAIIAITEFLVLESILVSTFLNG